MCGSAPRCSARAAANGERDGAPVPHRQAIALGCALLLGAAIAFPAGILLGGGGAEPQGSPAPNASGGPFRRVYSPAIFKDPSFLEQQRENVETLEQACRSSGDFCAESRLARQRLGELEQER